MQLPAPFRLEADQIVADLPHGRAVFSTARGGVSSGPYDSLNLGMLTEDTKANVDENRRRLGEHVGHPWPRFCYGRQVHGNRVRRATEPPSAERPYTEEDGQATALDDAAAIVFVADCLPILLAASGAVAALHGGWRPLAGNIVDEGVAALREVGGTGPITAALGPSARGCCYEVSDEVHSSSRPTTRGGVRTSTSRWSPARNSRRTGSRSTTSGCARSAPSAGFCSPIAATRASPAASRGSCAGPERRPGPGEPGADPRGGRRGRRDPGRGQVRAARGTRRAGRGRRLARRREPRAGPGGEGRALPATFAGTSSASSSRARSSRSCRASS